MEKLVFIKDEKGRIIKAERGEKSAVITWGNDNLDIDFCNFVAEIVLTARGVGGNG